MPREQLFKANNEHRDQETKDELYNCPRALRKLVKSFNNLNESAPEC